MLKNSPKIRLIVGLGNFPAEYADTRHNAGRWLVENLAASLNVTLRHNVKLQSLVAKAEIDGENVLLAVPESYMNESGNAVVKVAHFYKIPPEEILVVHDELDFEPGVIKVKVGGGTGGHNGIASVARALSSKDFLRLRIGIGHPGDKDLVSDYVLHRPSKSDRNLIDEAILRGLNVIPDIVGGEIEKASNRVNG